MAPDDAASSQPASNGTESLSTFVPAPPPATRPTTARPLSLATLAIHGDDALPGTTDVAPPIHLSTNYEYPSDLALLHPDTPHIDYYYSRERTPSMVRLEALLGPLLGTTPACTIVYTSGLAALHAIYVALAPARVAHTNGYHGATAVLELYRRVRPGVELLVLPEPVDGQTEATAAAASPMDRLREGDVVHLETPTNPTGEARSIQDFAKSAHGKGAWLVVDGTFAPPGLQDPLSLGADVLMVSGTKYLGGHGDLLCGVIAFRDDEWGRAQAATMRRERMILGSVMGSIESWLCARSLRTLGMRVERQTKNSQYLVDWLEAEHRREGSVVASALKGVRHASVQLKQLDKTQGAGAGDWLRQQMPKGFGPVFVIDMVSGEAAKRLPGCLKLFMHATSLGGVESLVEWRIMSDPHAAPTLIRVSPGCEDPEDLRADLEQGLRAAIEGKA